MITSIDSASAASAAMKAPNGQKVQGGGFSEALEKGLRSVNQEILSAQDLAARSAAGEPVDLSAKVIASAKADLSLKLLVQARNKVIGAYEEIMRMQF